MDKVIKLAKKYLYGLEYFDNNFFDKFEEKLNTKKGFLYGSTKTNEIKYDDSINPLFKKKSYNINIKDKKCTFNPIICTSTTEFIGNNLGNIKLLGQGTFANVYTIGNDNRYVLKIMKYLKVTNNMKNRESQKNVIQDYENDYKKRLKNLFFNYILQLYLFKINKKNITCNIYEFGTVEYIKKNETNIYSYLYCIMENGGDSLEKYIINNKINNIQTIYKIFKICASHVNIIHKLDYIHLDIKLDNFLIKNNNIDSIKIIDFDTVLKKNTEINDKIGTPPYTHPDILNCNNKNKLKVSEKHDIFSLGCLYLFMLYTVKYPNKEIYVMPFLVEEKPDDPKIHGFNQYKASEHKLSENTEQHTRNNPRRQYYKNTIYLKCDDVILTIPDLSRLYKIMKNDNDFKNREIFKQLLTNKRIKYIYEQDNNIDVLKQKLFGNDIEPSFNEFKNKKPLYQAELEKLIFNKTL